MENLGHVKPGDSFKDHELVVRFERGFVNEQGEALKNTVGPNGEKRWYVFEGDWGGQVYASVPLEVISEVTDDQLHAFLSACDDIAWACNEGEGVGTCVVEDRGAGPDWDDESDAGCDAIDTWYKLQEAVSAERMCGPADMFKSSVSLLSGLTSWSAVGGVTGGMGGGLLLADDLWLHDEFLRHGADEVNRLRALLNLAPLEVFDRV